MNGFGNRFASWCHEQGIEPPDDDLTEVLNEVGQKVAADLERQRPALIEQAVGLAQFLQTMQARRAIHEDLPTGYATTALQATEAVQYSTVEIETEALNNLIFEAQSHGANETGGRLAGYIDAARLALRITHATAGGPNARREPHLFISDAEFSQAALNDIVRDTGGKSDYVGEWHRHVGFQTHPSITDVATMKTIAGSANYFTPQPCLIICGLPDVRFPYNRQITAYTCARGAVSEVPLQVIPR
jgi:integrative and conjugative element protein (TIGR02256 family)